MEFRYERYQALDRVAWINYQAKGIQATKMIRGFLRLLLIASAVAALAAENSAVPLQRMRSNGQAFKPPDRHPQPPRRHR